MLEYLNTFANSPNHPIGLIILFVSSMIEYLFPPFPGDTITLFGAVLITAYQWSFFWVFAVTTLGSLLGAAGDYGLGVLAKRRKQSKNTAEKSTTRKSIEKIVEKFQKHGELYIIINRFLPGIRALFFYAAGYAGMRFSLVLLYAGISAIAWNLLLVGVGASIGANFEEMKNLALQYTTIVWISLGVIFLLWILQLLWRRYQKNKKLDSSDK